MGSVVDDLTGGHGRAAAGAQQAAARGAADLTRQQFDQMRGDLSGYRDIGARALAGLEDPNMTRSFTMDDFQADPGYQFRMDQANKALENSAASRGGLLSGNAIRSVAGLNQNLASQEFSAARDRFNQDRDVRRNYGLQLAGIGQNAAAMTGQAGMQMANTAGQMSMGGANAQAAYAQQNLGATNDLLGQAAMVLAFSDRRLKKNIEEVSKEDLAELRQTIKPYAFNYVDDRYGKGDWVGVMAQDLEKTKLGKKLVVENSAGEKMIDIRKVASLFLAAMAEAA